MTGIEAQRDALALQIARGAAIAVAIGAVFSPPVANVAAVFMVGAFFGVPDWRARLRRLAATPLAKGVALFAATLLVATGIAAYYPQGLSGGLQSLAGWRTLVLLVVACAVFDAPRWKNYLAWAFIAFAALAAIASAVAFVLNWGYKDQAAGIILRNSVTQAMTFAIGAYFAIMLLATRAAHAPWLRYFLWCALVLLVAVLVFLQTGRSGQILFAILALVAAALMLRGTRRLLAIAAVPVLGLLAYGASPVMQERFTLAWQELGNAHDAEVYTSMGIRVVMWQNSLALIRARPVLGYGLGGTEPAYSALIKDRASGWKATVTGDPHNQFLAIWIEAGAAGVIAFVFLLVALAMQPAPLPWRVAAHAFLVAWCVTSMFSSHFQTFNEGHLIAILLGALLASESPDERAPQPSDNAAATAAATSS